MKNKFSFKGYDLWLAYQPQYFNNKIILRSSLHRDSFPKNWYESLGRDEIIKLDILIIENTLIEISKYNFIGTISINVNLDFFTKDNLNKMEYLLSKYKVDNKKIILEVLEKDLILEEDLSIFNEFISNDIRLAIDDLPVDFSIYNLLVFKRYFEPKDFICKINTNHQCVDLNFIYSILDLECILVLEQANPKDFPRNIVKRVQFQSFELSKPMPIDRLVTI